MFAFATKANYPHRYLRESDKPQADPTTGNAKATAKTFQRYTVTSFRESLRGEKSEPFALFRVRGIKSERSHVCCLELRELPAS